MVIYMSAKDLLGQATKLGSETIKKYMSGAGGTAKGVLSQGMKNIKDVGFKGGGEYIEAAITGAVGWGAVGAVTEVARGGSAIEGAKRNVVRGAIGGTAYRGLKIGATGQNWASSSMSDVYGGISKQVKDINLNSKNVSMANGVMNRNLKIGAGGQVSMDLDSHRGSFARNLHNSSSSEASLNKALRIGRQGQVTMSGAGRPSSVTNPVLRGQTSMFGGSSGASVKGQTSMFSGR